LIDSVDCLLAKYSETPIEIPIYGEDWLEKQSQTLAEAKQAIPNRQGHGG
jgi:type I restriction enzyme M protein